MLIWLQELESSFGPFRLFGYTSVRAVGAALTAFIVMLLTMPWLIGWLRRKKFGEQGGKEEGAQVVDEMRLKKAGTPTMGGLGLIASLSLSVVLWCDPFEPFTWLLLTALWSFGLLGLLDDRTKIFKGAVGMRKRTKMVIQLVVAVALGCWLVSVDDAYHIVDIAPIETATGGWVWDVVGQRSVDGVVTLPLIGLQNAVSIGSAGLVVWTVVISFACSNSVNFTDGMDGLAAGVMLIAVLAFMVIAYIASHFVAAHHLGILHVPGAQEVAVCCAATAGACLGFLWFNAAPAKVFMGDTGSQALGGLLAMVSLCCKQEFLILVVGFVFFMEGLSVAAQVGFFKATKGRRLLRCAPIHHHFQYLGWPETTIVMRFYVLAAVAALFALVTLKLR